MSAQELDIILLTIAVIFQPPDSLPAISSEQISEVLKGPISVGQTPIGVMTISSVRDQIEAQLGLNKLDVRDLSGKIEHATQSVPIAVEGLMGLLGAPKVISYGINVVAELPKEEVEAWIGSTFLNSDAFPEAESQLSSNSVTVQLSRSSKKVNVK